MVQEVSGDRVMFGLFVGDLVDARVVELIDPGARISQQDGRVSGDDEL
ncbi:hypothetical protein [Candidatus Dactylopiibacterium carminicum]|nr:hypothetical protein [Candidatus Dactylopiibacterium carminicum]